MEIYRRLRKKPEKHSRVPSFLSGDLQVYVTEQR